MKAKKLPFKETVSLIVFFLIVCVSLLFVYPVFLGVSKKLSSSLKGLFASIEEKTALNITYRSLSPAVFSGIKINDVVIYDSFEDIPVLKIKGVSLHYNLFKLLKKDFTHVFTDLTVDGIVIELDKDDNSGLFAKLGELSSGGSGGLTTDLFNLNKFFDVSVKNIHVSYSEGSNTADAFFKKISLSILEKQKTLSVKTTGSLLYYQGETSKSLSCNFLADGAILENLDGSTVSFRISDFTDGNFNFKRLNLLFAYENDKASFTTVKNSYPFVLSGSYDLESSDAQVSFKANSLTAGTLVTFKKSNALLEVLDNLVVNTELSASYNTKEKVLGYKALGDVKVLDPIFRGGEKFSFALGGNEKEVQVDSLSAEGEGLNAEFSGNLEVKKLRLSGILSLYNYTIENGGVISTEVFFEPNKKGFMAFAPQLMFDDKSFTALQLDVSPSDDSIDFMFELSDYAHIDYEKPGKISVSGSYLTHSNYVQLNVSGEDMFLDSVAEAGLFFTEKKGLSLDFLSPFMFNGDVYLSSDFKTVSYNLPYLLVADTKKDDLFLYASIDGNDTSVSISRVDLIHGGNLSNLSARIELSPDHKEAFFTLDANHQSIPYHLAGNVMERNVSVSGDWGLSFNLHNSKDERFDGAFSLESFPLKFSDSIFTFSLDTAFSYSERDGFALSIARFESEDVGNKFPFHPHLIFSGSASKYGAFLDHISYSDKFSALSGDLNLVWNLNENIFSSANLDFNMKNQLSAEAVTITAELSNPNFEEISGANFKNALYLNSQVVINNLGLSRFLTETSDNNQISGTFIASGTLDNPYVAADLDSVKLMLAGNLLTVSGSGFMEEKELSLNDINVSYSGFELSGIKASFDLGTFNGSAEAAFDTYMGGRTLHVPINLAMKDSVIAEGKMFPEDFTLSLSFEDISGTLLSKPLPLSITVLHSQGETAVYSSELFGFSGFIAGDGTMNFSVPSDRALSFTVKGNAFSEKLDISIENISANMNRLMGYFNLGDFVVHRGVLRGNLGIGGLKSDPDFDGKLMLSNADWEMRNLVPSHVTSQRIPINFDHNLISIPEFKAMIKKSNVFYAAADVYFDRWNFDHVEASLRTPKDSFIPVSVVVPQAELKGELNSSVNIVFQDNIADVSGYLSFKNTNAKVTTRDLIPTSPFQQKTVVPREEIFVHTDLDIFFGQHVNFTFDPVLRAVFVPETKFNLKCDTEDKIYNLDGDILLRSGDIAYLSRNFYLKNGILRFNKNETTLNPYITVTAETREKDSDGNDVRIILSVMNQELLNFEPQFSSIPVKSENEIRELLGQIALGDSENVSSFLLATGDYAIQSTIGRSLENTLREYLNFDIFSVRTKVLQNALKQNFSANSDGNKLAIGNYLDNSTVYMGKYFGSSLYADALMHLSYDEGVEGYSELGSGGLEFQPEIGFEMDISQVFAPLWGIFLPKIGLNPSLAVANIRWSLDFNYQPATAVRFDFNNAITLSWKLSF